MPKLCQKDNPVSLEPHPLNLTSMPKHPELHIKDDVKSVLRIGSAHNKGGPADINIARRLHFSNFFDIKLWFIFIYEYSKPGQIVYHILQIW